MLVLSVILLFVFYNKLVLLCIIYFHRILIYRTLFLRPLVHELSVFKSRIKNTRYCVFLKEYIFYSLNVFFAFHIIRIVGRLNRKSLESITTIILTISCTTRGADGDIKIQDLNDQLFKNSIEAVSLTNF